MNKPQLASAITGGSSHYIEECLSFQPTLGNVDLTVVTIIDMCNMETTG